MMDMKTQLDEYSKKLESLQKQCTQAEKDSIVAETNYTNLIKQKEQLVNELESFANCSFEDIPDMLQKEQNELQSIMTRLLAIDTTTVAVNSDMLNEINSIIDEFNIQKPVE